MRRNEYLQGKKKLRLKMNFKKSRVKGSEARYLTNVERNS